MKRADEKYNHDGTIDLPPQFFVDVLFFLLLHVSEVFRHAENSDTNAIHLAYTSLFDVK